jgi:hypothetical protein
MPSRLAALEKLVSFATATKTARRLYSGMLMPLNRRVAFGLQ